MARVDPFSVLYSNKMSALDFKWDTMVAPPLLSLISMQDIYALNQISTSNKLASNPDEKYRLINNILTSRGFKKIASGTNRVAYKYLENQNLCLKVAIDRVGLKDNPAEFQNQFKLKPFVVKLFEVSPCGTVALEERVEPLVHIEEYINIIDDVFNFIIEKIIGKYVVDDIGTEYWQNIGLRKGFGPVLLDFPYVYELDGSKIYCNWMNPDTHEYCLGEIDYDDGFNHLVCSKCGKSYFAKQLGKQVEKRAIIIDKKGGIPPMSIKLMRGNEVVQVFKTERESATITPPEKKGETIKPRIKNMNKFEKRNAEAEKKTQARKEAVESAAKQHGKKMKEQVEEGLKNIQESGSSVTPEPETKEVTLKELSGDPNYLKNSRFELNNSVPQAEEERPVREVKVGKHDESLTLSMGEVMRRAFGGEMPSLSETLEKQTEDMAKTIVEATVNMDEESKEETVVAEESVEPNTADDIEYDISESEEEITDDMAKGSSWNNPVKCTGVEITVEEKDDEEEQILKMF